MLVVETCGTVTFDGFARDRKIVSYKINFMLKSCDDS
jgi:hypothetical protein